MVFDDHVVCTWCHALLSRREGSAGAAGFSLEEMWRGSQRWIADWFFGAFRFVLYGAGVMLIVFGVEQIYSAGREVHAGMLGLEGAMLMMGVTRGALLAGVGLLLICSGVIMGLMMNILERLDNQAEARA